MTLSAGPVQWRDSVKLPWSSDSGKCGWRLAGALVAPGFYCTFSSRALWCSKSDLRALRTSTSLETPAGDWACLFTTVILRLRSWRDTRHSRCSNSSWTHSRQRERRSGLASSKPEPSTALLDAGRSGVCSEERCFHVGRFSQRFGLEDRSWLVKRCYDNHLAKTETGRNLSGIFFHPPGCCSSPPSALLSPPPSPEAAPGRCSPPLSEPQTPTTQT